MTILEQEIHYQVNGQNFIGFCAQNSDKQAPSPAVLLVHEWWGHNDYVRDRARQLAANGCIAFALDMYGDGKSSNKAEKASEFMGAARAQPGAIEARFDAAYQALSALPGVDATNISAMGYCFGGAVVLAMARLGKTLKVAASFHGLLETETPLQQGVFNGQVLVFNGADDPLVSAEALSEFEQEMQAASANFSIENYPGALHGFTNPLATARGEKTGMPLRYDAAADQDSYQKTLLQLMS